MGYDFRYLKYFLLLVSSLLFNINQSSGQEKFRISAGAGIIELYNVCLRYQIYENIQVGWSIGINGWGRTYSIASDIYYHFGRVSEISKRKSWYTKTGLDLYHEEIIFDDISNYLFLNVKVGRDLNFSRKIGVNMDAGIGLGFDTTNRFNPFLAPSLGISLFYRIK